MVYLLSSPDSSPRYFFKFSQYMAFKLPFRGFVVNAGNVEVQDVRFRSALDTLMGSILLQFLQSPILPGTTIVDIITVFIAFPVVAVVS